MRSSTFLFDQRVPVSQIRSCLVAWGAVRDDMPRDEFLRWRLRLYEALYRLSQYPLPSVAIIEDGEVKEIANTDFDVVWQQTRDDPAGEDAGVTILTELEREEIARELEELEAEIARINHERHDVREQMDTLAAEQDDAIRRGAVLSPTTTRRPAPDRLRPRLSFPWILVAGCLAILLMILFEAYQLAVPILDLIGVDTTRLGREWRLNPVGVASGAGFALSATVGLLLLWHLVLSKAALVSKTWDSAGPVLTALRVGGIVGLGCILLAFTFVLANMRHGLAEGVHGLLQLQQGQPSGAGIGQGIFLCLTLLVPFAAAYIHHQISQSQYWVRRRDITREQKQWDQKEEERVLTAERLADRRNLRQQEQERLERQRTHLQKQRQALAQRAQAAQRQQLERLKKARMSTDVYARSLLAALEQDRYFFIRIANRCKADHLVPEQVRCHAKAQTQPSLPFHTLLPAGSNGKGD